MYDTAYNGYEKIITNKWQFSIDLEGNQKPVEEVILPFE